MKRSVLVTALILALMTPGVGQVDAASSETYRQHNLFGDVFERVRAEYVEEVTDEELIEAAIRGMLTSLDPHSSYLNPEEYRESQIVTTGQFGGLGIEINMEDGLLRIISPIADTPAFRAGLKPGDFIVGVNGDSIKGMSLLESVKRLRGKPDRKSVG